MFVLQIVQPGLAGLMDGSVSTLAPLFAAAFATHSTRETFLVGLAASVGAGISMGFAEAMSDDGTLTGRAGYSDEDQDSGRWWVEGDRWFRQWKQWAYGESVGYHTVVDGEQVRWFSAEGLLLDTAVIVRRRGARR